MQVQRLGFCRGFANGRSYIYNGYNPLFPLKIASLVHVHSPLEPCLGRHTCLSLIVNYFYCLLVFLFSFTCTSVIHASDARTSSGFDRPVDSHCFFRHTRMKFKGHLYAVTQWQLLYMQNITVHNYILIYFSVDHILLWKKYYYEPGTSNVAQIFAPPCFRYVFHKNER